MGKRWDRFVNNFGSRLDEKPEDFNVPAAVTVDPEPEQEPRFEIKRAYTADPISNDQRRDLAEVREMAGYDVLRIIMERTAEGFVSTLVQTNPKHTEDVLTYHKLAYAAWRYYESFQRQVDYEVSIDAGNRKEQQDLDAVLRGPKMPDLNDPATLNRLLNPLYVAPEEETETIRPEAKPKKETPLEIMLNEGK